ncbi:MAG TPA: hypothetical protein VFW87_09565 [Pirellulales bacterium]|nr:hypothetical protein [Pirellulales bacterium]
MNLTLFLCAGAAALYAWRNRKKITASRVKAAAAAVVAVPAVCIVLCLALLNASDNARAKRKLSLPRAHAIAKGQLATLSVPGQPTVWTCATEQALEEMLAYSRQHNETAIERMIRADGLMVDKANTKATVTDPGIMTCRVRIEEGPHAGREGFLATEHVHPAPP